MHRPRTATRVASRLIALTFLTPGTAAVALLMSLVLVAGAVVPRASAATTDTSKLFWLPRQQATHVGWPGYVHPSVATYHNHAYILNVNDGISPTNVSFTTNESGSWKTQVLSAQKPANEFTALAVDASTGRLYAVWIYKKTADTVAIGVWTRDASGQWSSDPTDLDVEPALYGRPSVVAGNGKAYVAFSSEYPGACDSRRADVQVVTYDGSNWSTPQNLTSCVSDPTVGEFDNPELALDESGHVYLVSLVLYHNLWYMDAAGGSWSQPVEITHGVDIGLSASSFATSGTYSIAASEGTAYVAYAQHLTDASGSSLGSDIVLLAHPSGGSWSAPIRASPPDPAGCLKWGLSLVARSGRVGVSYIHGHTGFCHAAGNPDPAHSGAHVLTGTPGHLAAARLGTSVDCNDTALSSDGDLFRLITICAPAAGAKDDFLFTPEALDLVGPKAHISAPANARASAIRLRWSAQDPAPGSGVAYYALQVRVDRGSWHTLLATTHAKSLLYRQARKGHKYTFRLRARDKVNNWGAWVSASTRVS